ncbi:B3 domain-containing transcription factor VRN1 [Linum grandiflorum]
MVVYLLPCLLCFSSFRVSESFKTEESTFTIPTTMAARLHNPSPSSSSASPPLVSSASRPHQSFIRPILPVVLQANKMILPQKFVGLYGSELSSTAELSLPNGTVWTVGVEKGTNREVHFGENWVEFVKLYSISVGFFLRFDYRGDSKFAVQIYDLSCCGLAAAAAGDGEDGSVENFWRLIVPSVVREKQLRLPINFARKHGRKLAMRKYSNAELHLPNGTVCQSGITAGKDRQELWFKRGWSKFMEDNSVKENFLLTFEYAGGSRFNVAIFDRSTTAILHPPPPPPPQSPPPRVVVHDECKDLTDGLDAKGIAMAGKFRAHTFPTMSPGSKRAMREAIRSKRDDDVVPSFVVVMKPQRTKGFKRTYRFAIPYEIVEKLELEAGDRMNLQATGGIPDGFEIELKNQGLSLMISGDGWTTFFIANELKEGDVCLFQIGNGLATQVSIFRA